MIAEKSKLETVAEHVKDYLTTRYELAVLKVSDRSSSILSSVISYAVAAIVGVFFLLFLSLALALFISEKIGNSYAGFFIVAGFYLLIVVLVLVAREKMIRIPLLNAFIKQLCMEDKCDA